MTFPGGDKPWRVISEPGSDTPAAINLHGDAGDHVGFAAAQEGCCKGSRWH